MRPLFPKDYRNDVTLNNLVMSVDPECRPEIVAMLGSAIATCISDIPFDGPCAMTQVGMKDGEFVINPSQEVWDNGDLQLTVASTREKVIMIEAGANEIPEDKMIELSKRIKTVVDDKAKYTDWSTRDDIKANLQVDLILLLDEFGYPPVTIDDVYKEVLEQAENFKKYAN